MTTPPFVVSQDLLVRPPKKTDVYMIPCDDWAFLKKKLASYTKSPWVFHTVGSILLGASVTTFVGIGTGAYPSTTTAPGPRIAAWAAAVACAVIGAMALVFSGMQRRQKRDAASDITALMDLIEQRYERAGEKLAAPLAPMRAGTPPPRPPSIRTKALEEEIDRARERLRRRDSP